MLCQICQCDIESQEASHHCSSCSAPYHQECWEDVGGCAVYGCQEVPKVEARSDLEVPSGHWGQEKKPCPACGEEIQALAVRCRHCGEVFESSQPVAGLGYQNASLREKEKTTEQRRAMALFAMSVLSCLAPLSLILSGHYLRTEQEKLERQPSLTAALVKLAFGISVVQVSFFFLISCAFMIKELLS